MEGHACATSAGRHVAAGERVLAGSTVVAGVPLHGGCSDGHAFGARMRVELRRADGGGAPEPLQPLLA